MTDHADRLNDAILNRTQRLAEVERDASHPNQRPRDAATLILIDRAGPAPRVLLGRRHHGHKFMPGKFVFPGGRVETLDSRMPVATALDPAIETRLMRSVQRPSAAKARGYALAAVRETFEETGLLLGRKQLDEPVPSALPGQPWADFATAGFRPDLGSLHFIARAITPPRRIRRFDSRFFAADASAIAHRVEGVVGPDAELVELVWIPLTEAKRLDMSMITEVALEELDDRIARGFAADLPVPFYHVVRGRFVRDLL
jgi:8-oxo-dGTP pyrophosphatase MutT (NUDIX family)